MDRFYLLKNRILKIIKKSKIKTDYIHALSTYKWILHLNPHASDELLIAGLAHDIERAFTQKKTRRNNEKYEEYKKRHAKQSAIIIADLMKIFKYKASSIKQVNNYVEKHETGGDSETNFLMDADSISYFENNIEPFFHSTNSGS